MILVAHQDQCLSDAGFKEAMSHIVKDLAGSIGSVPTRCVSYTPIYGGGIKFPIVTSLNGFMTCTEAGE